ncbi:MULTISPECIES: molybdopterin converting factor subunit 1 [Parageobacillus]|jgi:sulfur-carrier protein|uniref:Molybdopterin synthase sulfur carrier subunit n=1 Tax=Parageobacillus thermoglucosidasius TaxID=1426 RepID=A0A1B7KPI1_PARTM|nr:MULTISPECIES: molybdopterin converting factor subunit 1 [Parageobacillus]OAT71982.1 molybdopterin converting factor subunit 1 [Parageobacillus thermoglucosidasius]BDG48413.1 molybdopterin synthase sulfur carrier subunit [Parageobacillus sp. KH3-4]
MITLLFFAHLQEAVGEGRIVLSNVPETVKALKEEVENRYHIDLKQVMVAVNEEYARDDQTLQPGDVVAFIPPVSGG